MHLKRLLEKELCFSYDKLAEILYLFFVKCCLIEHYFVERQPFAAKLFFFFRLLVQEIGLCSFSSRLA